MVSNMAESHDPAPAMHAFSQLYWTEAVGICAGGPVLSRKSWQQTSLLQSVIEVRMYLCPNTLVGSKGVDPYVGAHGMELGSESRILPDVIPACSKVLAPSSPHVRFLAECQLGTLLLNRQNIPQRV